ncbi:Atrial natriuretic peptide receptor 1 [Portunus trituberculatus]|uniref:Atrial natriuretic peptide receptor 1 n=1 Tax=Portunus trituberculatus TaxID=210409 RepID=A0A5B7JEC0_PORTR|nr:Atrial natriuretic peptide receptor 1 [Portunus trituberculatus]
MAISSRLHLQYHNTIVGKAVAASLLFLYPVLPLTSRYSSTDVFLGPVEAYVLAPVARFSGAWNVPLLTPGGQPNAFDTRKDYPLLTRLKGFYTEVRV